MAWDKGKAKDKSDDVGYTVNSSGTQILEWQERAPGRELLAHGVFDLMYPCIAVAAYDDRRLITCPELRRAIPPEEFERRQVCRNCRHRTPGDPVYPFAPSASSRDTSMDLAGLTSFTFNRIAGSSMMLVPAGCPCRGIQSPFFAHRKLVPIQSLYNSSSFVPKAWKITYDGHSLRLSIQFRRLYITRDGKVSNDGFFQHVVCDLDGGKTYVTALSDGSRRHVPGDGKRPVDDVTYTGSADYCPNGAGLFTEQLMALYAELTWRLSEKGLLELGDDEEVDLAEDELIASIARLNRWPGLADVPFKMRWAWPDRIQRKISSAPRAGMAALMAHLGFDPENDELRDVFEVEPAAVECAYILKELGCNDEEALGLLGNEGTTGNVSYFLRKFVGAAGQEGGFDGLDCLELMLPRVGTYGNWWKTIADIAAIGNEASRRSSNWINSFAKNAAVAARSMAFPKVDRLRDMMAAVNRPLEGRRDIADRLDAALSDRFQSSKRKWACDPLSPEQAEAKLKTVHYQFEKDYRGASIGSCVVLGVRPEDGADSDQVDIALGRSMALDRRKWRGRLQRDYRTGRIEPRDLPAEAFKTSYSYEHALVPVILPIGVSSSLKDYEKAICKWGKKHYVDVPKRPLKMLR